MPDNSEVTTMRELAANMLMVGFPEEQLDADSPICRQIQKTGLGGVVLFDRFYDDRDRVKNIRDSDQLAALTKVLHSCSDRELIIAVDQEGGRVARLKPEQGFVPTPSAAKVSGLHDDEAKRLYEAMGSMLHHHGVNCNFAPVVDLAVNPHNPVIAGIERSYGVDAATVIRMSECFIDAMHANGVMTSLKHFPGHGSSRDDSHQGFTDVTETWNRDELEPFDHLIRYATLDMIMTAHVFNRHLDPDYPATLSKRIIMELLRHELGYGGVVISDDLQMHAIADHYSLEETLTLAINSGIDLLLFGNQLGHHDVGDLIDAICLLVDEGKISREQLEASNWRIEHLKARYRDRAGQ
jgi:beta-N-acetylhexosaminidase